MEKNCVSNKEKIIAQKMQHLITEMDEKQKEKLLMIAEIMALIANIPHGDSARV